jgi:phospholipase C
MKRGLLALLSVATMAALPGLIGQGVAGAKPELTKGGDGQGNTATPIQHLVVIFQENVSFDHYFATYPKAANTDGQPFQAKEGTPGVNGLSGTLLTNNPNRSTTSPNMPANPVRYANTVNDVLTCDQNHEYLSEQVAFNGGKMDKFPQTVGTGAGKSATGQTCVANDVMNYYDGNTTTALWNYAQHYAMSDNSWDTTFGPSTPGAINLISGNTGTVDPTSLTLTKPPSVGAHGDVVPNGQGGYSVIADPQPAYDDCSSRDSVKMTGTNVGDLLNKKGLSWGFFQGGFAPTTPISPTNSKAVCGASHPIGAAVGGTGQWGTKGDYIPHHEPFQYYASTSNPHHLAPTSDAAIGTTDQANHQYDMSDFDRLVADIQSQKLSPDHLPAVSYLKAPGYQDGHAGYSDPIDEQQFVVNEINALQQLPTWKNTAVVIAYDDSDGWYDHAFSGVHNPSVTVADALTAPGQCGSSEESQPLGGDQGRCGYGPRQPLLVISPFAKTNFVDHRTTDLSSILKFVQDNWDLPRIDGSFSNIAGSLNGMFDFQGEGQANRLILNPSTGQTAKGGESGLS